MSALRQFADDGRIAWACCGIMLKLATTGKLAELLVALDGVSEAFSAVLRDHGRDARLCRAASGVLARLTASSS